MSLRFFLLTLLAVLPVQANIRNTTRAGIPLFRTDAANIQFILHSSLRPGVKNKDGVPVITPSSDPAGAARAAADTWGSVKTAAVKFAPFQSTSTLQANASDGNNIITAEDTPEHRSLVGSFLAITIFAFNNQGQITDADIIFNPAVTDPNNGNPIPFSTLHEPNSYDFLGTLTHELGHALGSAHSPLLCATMFQASYYVNQFVTGYESSSQSILSTDDVAFLSSVYPAPGASIGTIAGTVRLDTGAAVVGALVIATNGQGAVIGAMSSLNDGSYAITGLPPDSYFVYAQPLDAAVRPGNITMPNIAAANVSFRTTLAGGNTTPAQIVVTAGATANADITVSSAASNLRIDQVGTGSVGGQDWAYAIPKQITAGQSRDILLWGKGIDSTLSESQIQVLTSGVTIRPFSLRSFPSAVVSGMTAMRFTVDAAPASSKTPVVILVNKQGDVAANTGGLFVIPPPQFTADAIVNAASFKGAAIVPGEVITLFGSNFGPSEIATLTLDATGRVSRFLADTALYFDGIPAPMIYSVNGQLSTIVPYAVAGKTSSNVLVYYGGAFSAGVAVPVAQTSPALFTLSASGTGQGAILNQDSSVNTPSHPAAQGSVVVLFGTGLGVVTPAALDGEITPGTASTSLSVKVTIGGRGANILYAGAAPSLVSGVFQINAQLPSGIGSGAVPILVTVGTATTPAGVTVSVQ